jgi:hypothetical protein
VRISTKLALKTSAVSEFGIVKLQIYERIDKSPAAGYVHIIIVDVFIARALLRSGMQVRVRFIGGRAWHMQIKFIAAAAAARCR